MSGTEIPNDALPEAVSFCNGCTFNDGATCGPVKAHTDVQDGTPGMRVYWEDASGNTTKTIAMPLEALPKLESDIASCRRPSFNNLQFQMGPIHFPIPNVGTYGCGPIESLKDQ